MAAKKQLVAKNDLHYEQVSKPLFINRPRVRDVVVAHERDVLRDGRLCCKGEDLLSDKHVLQALKMKQHRVSIKDRTMLWALADKDLLGRKGDAFLFLGCCSET